MSAWAIVPAAGEGSRLGAPGPKPLQPLAGMPMICHSLVALAKAPSIERIVVAAPDSWVARLTAVAASAAPGIVDVITGGATRQASVFAALHVVPQPVERIVVHDAARPLVTEDLVEAALGALAAGGVCGAVCAVPVADTLKRADADTVVETVSRASLWQAQTPQAFVAGDLRRAHAEAAEDGFQGTDDAALLERIGLNVVLVPGSERNVKVTTPADLALAEALLAGR